jgi:dienelactone hydrolase
VPDVWEGDNVPLNWEPTSSFNLGQWMRGHMPDKVAPICEAAIKTMRDEMGVQKLGGVGYCLGAKYVCRFLASGKGLDAGYFAHPSATTGDEVKGVAGPLSIAAAGEFFARFEYGKY